MQEIMMPLLLHVNWYHKSFYIVFVYRHLTQTHKQGSCSTHLLSVFSDRIVWFESVLHAVISQWYVFQSKQFWNWTRLRDCCHFAEAIDSFSCFAFPVPAPSSKAKPLTLKLLDSPGWLVVRTLLCSVISAHVSQYLKLKVLMMNTVYTFGLKKHTVIL